jgi:hypothetical protein
MKKIILLFMIVTSLSFGSVVQGQNDYLIVPGERVGSIALGMSVDDMLRILGRPSSISKNPPDHPVKTQIYYFGRIFVVSISPIPEVEVLSISTTSKEYVTDKGIKVGSSGTDVVRAYGRDYFRYEGNAEWFGEVVTLLYQNLGINFVISARNNSVVSVGVSAPQRR